MIIVLMSSRSKSADDAMPSIGNAVKGLFNGLFCEQESKKDELQKSHESNDQSKTIFYLVLI